MRLSILSLLFALAPPVLAQEVAGDEVWNLERMREVSKEIQGQIEALRGLAFESEVRIELANPESFLAYAKRTLEADGGRERMLREEEVAKLLGLVPGDMDLLALTAEVLAEQVGGFYDAKTKTFYVMESVQPDLARIVIAHEFTHALDDQHFRLDETRRDFDQNADAAMAYHAVVEGSGMEIMFQWARLHMDAEELTRVGRAQADLPADVVGKAPPVVWKPLVALYYQGQAFLRRQRRPSPLSQDARMGDVDRALASPPRSTEQVIHPLKYWSIDHKDEPIGLSVQAEGLPEDASLRYENTMGELQVAMITTPFGERTGLNASLPSVLGLQFTNDAATGWGGDRYALLGQGDGQVLVWDTRWDTSEDADEFAASLSNLSEGIEAAKAKAPGHDPELSGLLVTRVGGIGAEVVSWSGMTESQAMALAGQVRFDQI